MSCGASRLECPVGGVVKVSLTGPTSSRVDSAAERSRMSQASAYLLLRRVTNAPPNNENIVVHWIKLLAIVAQEDLHTDLDGLFVNVDHGAAVANLSNVDGGVASVEQVAAVCATQWPRV
jgi:hypothetical protein